MKTKAKRKFNSSALSLKIAAGARSFLISSLPYVLCLTAVGVLVGAVGAYAVNSPAFGLAEVRILNAGALTQDQAFQFCELRRGENLVTLDLVNIRQVIKSKRPEFKEVRVQRILPNRVEVVLRRRTPVAQVAFSRFVQIDRDLVVLPGSAAVPFRNLTILEGVSVPRQGVTVGVVLSDARAKKAVKLAEILRRSDMLKNHSLTKIDIRDPQNLSLFVDLDIEIKIGNSHFMERLELLDRTLEALPLDRSKIRYIDLRFDDVVIGPR